MHAVNMKKLGKITVRLLALLIVLAPMFAASPAEAQGETRLVAFMTGAQETPPNASFGRGEAHVVLNQVQLCYTIRVTHLSGPATAAHIHVGPPGVGGPIVVPLNTPNANGFSHGCTSVDAHLIAAIRNNPGIYYVNVHTALFPGGEVRGQLQKE